MDPRIIQVAQIVTAIILTALILMQNRGTGLSGVFGGGGGVYRTKRGVEKGLFRATIVMAALFFAVSIARIFVY